MIWKKSIPGEKMNGFLFILVATVFWGVSEIFAKVGVMVLDPWSFTFVRSLFFFLVVTVITLRGGKFQWPHGRGAIYPIGAGVAMGTSIILFYNALMFYEISSARPIMSLNILVTICLSIIFLNEKLTLMKCIGIVLALGALALLSI